MYVNLFFSATMAPSPDNFVLRQQQPPLSPLDTDLLALSFKPVVSTVLQEQNYWDSGYKQLCHTLHLKLVVLSTLPVKGFPQIQTTILS